MSLRWRAGRATLATLAAVALVASACGGEPERPDGGPADGAPLAGPLLVSAAASLTDALAEIAAAFEAAHPRVEIVLNLGGSSALRAQILEGAPVDVFASAGRPDMDRVVAAGRTAAPPTVFARNRLQIAVPAGNPAEVRGLADFSDTDLLLGLCAAEVPCGALARRALAAAGVVPALDTEEPDVRALRTRVELGELDAGIVWITDVVSAGGAVEGIDIPDAANPAADYPMAVLVDGPNAPAARAFVRFALSDEARAIFLRHGFGPP